MIVVAQRCSSASVSVDEAVVSEIDLGLLLLVGIEKEDGQSDIQKVVNKTSNLRIFEDENNKMNYSLLDVKGSILVVSQFTLLANTQKGNRPSYLEAAKPSHAKIIYREFFEKLKNYEINVKKGRFGAHMKLDFINDGPVTILLGD